MLSCYCLVFFLFQLEFLLALVADLCCSTYYIYFFLTESCKNHAIFLSDLQSLASQSVICKQAAYTSLESLLEIKDHRLYPRPTE